MKKDNFAASWAVIRERGQEKFLVNMLIKLTPFLLILLVTKDFIVHNEVLNFSNLLDFVFKNLFISVGISALIILGQWHWNERKYKRIKR